MEFECDYDIYGDTRNRKGKIKDDYNGHNKGYKEQQRIYYVKQKRLMQSQASRVIDEDENDSFDETDCSRKRKLKYTADENDRQYGNNYSPVEKKNKKKKNSKKDKVRF